MAGRPAGSGADFEVFTAGAAFGVLGAGVRAEAGAAPEGAAWAVEAAAFADASSPEEVLPTAVATPRNPSRVAWISWRR